MASKRSPRTYGPFVGVAQPNIVFPRTLKGRGKVALTITIDGKIANSVKVNFK